MSHERTDFLATFQQRFERGQPNHDVLHNAAPWKHSIPHEFSGPCYTYDPPYDSDAGLYTSIFMRMKTNYWDPNVQIFLHMKSKFFYSTTSTYNTLMLDMQLLSRIPHPRAIGKKIFIDTIISRHP